MTTAPTAVQTAHRDTLQETSQVTLQHTLQDTALSPAPAPTPRHMKASRNAFPVNVGISAVAHHGSTAWGLVIDNGITSVETLSGTMTGDNIGAGLFAAFEHMNNHAMLDGAHITLFLDSHDHRDLFKDIADRLPRLSLNRSAGSFGSAARRAALTHLPDFPYPHAPITRRITVATDGSCGQAKRGQRGIGAGWISETGKYGYTASNDFKTPVDAELHGIYKAVKAHHREQPLHLVCDSQDAIGIINKILAGEPINTALGKHRGEFLADLRRVLHGHDVTIGWVRGHATNPLNIAADRLAVGVRRINQMGLPSADFAPIAERIAEDYLSGVITADILAELEDDVDDETVTTAA